jgi:hypothetical protein
MGLFWANLQSGLSEDVVKNSTYVQMCEGTYDHSHGHGAHAEHGADHGHGHGAECHNGECKVAEKH